MPKSALWFAAVLLLAPARGADVFTDGAGGAKVHEPSGFVCPLKLGEFERDAVGQKDPQTRTDYCAYSALDSVYAGVMLRPAGNAYDPKAALDGDFSTIEGSGGRILTEWLQPLGPKGAPLTVYLRAYETARLESLHYRTVYASAEVNGWAVQASVEYADPRDKELQAAFLEAVFTAAAKLAAKP